MKWSLMQRLKKAQLIIVGGRAYIPTILAVIHQKPDIIIAVSSMESKEDLPKLEQIIKSVHPEGQMIATEPVDAFNFSQIYATCENAILSYPKAEWIFNITTGTTIMSIGAYEVAKLYQSSTSPVQCWYINTSQTKFVSLPKDDFKGIRREDLFKISVPQYATAYSRTLLLGDLESDREYAEENYELFAQHLGKESIRCIATQISNEQDKR